MEELIAELKDVLSFKDSTDIGDIVLVIGENPQMIVYGYVTDIERDSSRRDEWWHVHFSLLTVPMQEVVWTLRTPQMTGMEIFTMGGAKRFVKAVDLSRKKEPIAELPERDRPQGKSRGKGKIVQFKKPGS